MADKSSFKLLYRRLGANPDQLEEICLAETMDDFLDLYNEIKNDPAIVNQQKGAVRGAEVSDFLFKMF